MFKWLLLKGAEVTSKHSFPDWSKVRVVLLHRTVWKGFNEKRFIVRLHLLISSHFKTFWTQGNFLQSNRNVTKKSNCKGRVKPLCVYISGSSSLGKVLSWVRECCFWRKWNERMKRRDSARHFLSACFWGWWEEQRWTPPLVLLSGIVYKEVVITPRLDLLKLHQPCSCFMCSCTATRLCVHFTSCLSK